MANENPDTDFGAILAEFEQAQSAAGGSDPKPGERISGRILRIGNESTFVDVGAKSDAVVATAELLDDEGELTAAVGDTVEGMISGRDEASGCLLLRVRPGAGSGLSHGDTELALEEVAQAHAHGIPVEGTVRAALKGGVEVEVSGLRGFCPISQLDTAYVEDAEGYVGQRLSFAVRSFERAGRGGRPNLVLSRRELLEAEERKRREEALARLKPGAVVHGKVTSVTGYGAFVDLGGVEGLLHVSEMAHGRVEDPAELVQEGDELDVKVLTIEEREGRDGKRPTQRISLSLRALLADPWEEIGQRFAVGSTVDGRVMRLEPFGAFVRIAPGVEGLVHVSELAADRHVSHPREVVELGQDVKVRILDVDAERKRISLSLAAAQRAGEADGGRAEAAAADAGGGLGSGLGSLAQAFEKADKKG